MPMFRRNRSQEGQQAGVSTKPKLSKLKNALLIASIAALAALMAVIKLNQIFHWWITPPW